MKLEKVNNKTAAIDSSINSPLPSSSYQPNPKIALLLAADQARNRRVVDTDEDSLMKFYRSASSRHLDMGLLLTAALSNSTINSSKH